MPFHPRRWQAGRGLQKVLTSYFYKRKPTEFPKASWARAYLSEKQIILKSVSNQDMWSSGMTTYLRQLLWRFLRLFYLVWVWIRLYFSYAFVWCIKDPSTVRNLLPMLGLINFACLANWWWIFDTQNRVRGNEEVSNEILSERWGVTGSRSGWIEKRNSMQRE